MKKCANCGSQNSNTANFYNTCGNKDEVKNFCSHCKKEIETNKQFCEYCGANFSKKTSTNKKLKVLLLTLVGLLIVICLLIGIGFIGCASETNNNSIVGEWRDGYGNKVEFYKDGTVVFGDEVAGVYSFPDDNHIKFSAEGLFGILGDQVFEIKISGSKLYLNSDFESFTYSKQENTAVNKAETKTTTISEATDTIPMTVGTDITNLILIIFISIIVLIAIILVIYRAGRTSNQAVVYKQKNYCSKCGNKITQGNNFCNKCGAKL